MISKNWLRYALGVILGGSAGLSLTATVLPFLLSVAGFGEEFLIRWDLGGYAAHCILAFAAGGWLIARVVGRIWIGALILGGAGLASGLVMALLAYPGAADRLLAMALVSGGYGAVGGLLLGHVLKKPEEADAGL